MTNFDLCANIFSILKACDVDTVVVCAGARNAPLVHHLEQQDFNKFYYFEERSAAFFALGLMKQSGRPVAVLTTSGTAAAELLPAAIESFYQGLPLILITADRPKLYRGCAAPQTINQIGLYSHYVEQSFDWDIYQKNFSIKTTLQSPIHFNLCFDEPLLDQASGQLFEVSVNKQPMIFAPRAIANDFSNIKKPLVIISQIHEGQKSEVIKFIHQLKAPVYLESLSLLQEEKSISKFILKSSDLLIKKLFQNKICESVIRIGGIPTLRFWRDLESEFKNIPVFNFSDLLFAGLSRSAKNFQIDFSSLASIEENKSWVETKTKDQQLQDLKLNLLKNFPFCEPACIAQLSVCVQSEPLYLGNSLPIREWDLFAQQNGKSNQQIYANRGANGIDGQISTYLGWSQFLKQSWCLVGDLTAMYDLASLGIASKNLQCQRRIVIMNNYGGQIFKRVFKNNHFLNSHHVEFEMWAKMWAWDYLKIQSEHDFQKLNQLQSAQIIIEIQPNANQTEKFWDMWDSVCSEI